MAIQDLARVMDERTTTSEQELSATGVILRAARPHDAEAAGRDPSALELIITSDPAILDESPGEGRPDFVGTYDEIRRDVMAARDLGATELSFMLGYSSGDLDLDEYMRTLERLITLV